MSLREFETKWRQYLAAQDCPAVIGLAPPRMNLKPFIHGFSILEFETGTYTKFRTPSRRMWNASTRSYQEETEAKPLTVHETGRAAQRELLAVLRLIDAGKVAVGDKTHR